MATSASTGDVPLGEQPSPAELLRQKHNEHHATVEDAPDEDVKQDSPDGPSAGGSGSSSWAQPMSANAAGKQKATAPSTSLDTQSHDAFPELGAAKKPGFSVPPAWGARTNVNGNGKGKTDGANGTNGNSRASTPASGAATPASSAVHGPPSLSIPGRNTQNVVLEPHHMLPPTARKRPIQDVIKDLNRKSRANITSKTLSGGRMQFDATGPPEPAQQALKDLVAQIGAKQSIKVPIPQSARAHIIGKQGSTIKSLQEKTGARIQLPKPQEAPVGEDDDDASIDVIVEGDALSAAAARDAIIKIAGERTANSNIRMRDIPSEFYPFITDSSHGLLSRLESNGVQVRVPDHHPQSSQPPSHSAHGQRPVFYPATGSHVHLAGDRAAVQNARADIQRLVDDLHQTLGTKQIRVPRTHHSFVIGDRGIPMSQFFNETGCAITLPTDEGAEMVTITGPADRVAAGRDKVEDLISAFSSTTFPIASVHRKAPGGAAAHAANVTRYLKSRNELDRLQSEYETFIHTPAEEDDDEYDPSWTIFSRDNKKALKAQNEMREIVSSHPPSRIARISVDPFFHQHLRKEISPRVQQDHGVYMVIPDGLITNSPVLLVYEGPSAVDTTYRVPRNQPSADEIRTFEKQIREAQKHILDLINEQEDIIVESVDVPLKFHEKLRRFIKREQANQSPNQIPVRVSSVDTTVTLRGTTTAVKTLLAKVKVFIEQEKEDEKERGFTLSFDFPQKFASHLIGSGGSNIRDLRDKHDVEIQVQNGVVELKGPKAKAEAARKEIEGMRRQLENEMNYALKIDPQFHQELIGKKGSNINRLQDRHSVLIFFPRSAKAVRDDDSNADAASEVGKPRRQQAPDEVLIRGPKKGADAARDEILEVYQYLKDHSETATVVVQRKQLPTLIGQRGSAMDTLRQQTGARIEIPNDRDSPESKVEIQIKGTKSEVAAAKKALEEKRKVFDDTVAKSIHVDKKYHRALIGAGGSNLRDLVVKAGGSDDRRELSRTIQFPKPGDDGDVIKIEGRSSVVDKIVTQIEEFVSQRDSQTTDVVDVPTDKHRSLIGRQGAVKRQIESQFQVSIDIPRQGSGQTDVKIAGQPENVEKAKSHILSLIKEPHGETVEVPRALHHVISNGGQFFRKLSNEHKVTVDHAGHSIPPRPSAPNTRTNGGSLPLITDEADPSDVKSSWVVSERTSAEEGNIPWVLRGSPENVEQAKKLLAAAVAQAEKSNVTGYLSLDEPRNYRHVIGHRGQKIDSIRKQSGCRINVPTDKSNDDAIEVSGSREDVEKAKDLILEAVREGIKGAK